MSKKPNIVFLLNDHQAYYRHGWDKGQGPKRPEFDKLASEGIEFSNCYTVAPMCGPARRSMITGLLPSQHKMHHNYTDSPYEHEVYFDSLDKVGYDNFYFGKWHAGPGSAMDFKVKDGLSNTSYGNPYITKEYDDYLKKNNLPQASHKIERVFYIDDMVDQGMFSDLREGATYSCKDAWCGEHAFGVTTTPKETHESFFLANLACDKLEEIKKSKDDTPFTLRVDFWGPHQPFFPTQEFLDMYDVDEIETYGSLYDNLVGKPKMYSYERNRPLGNGNDIILPTVFSSNEWKKMLHKCYAHGSMIDAAGGLIINKLKELGLDENTIIIWSTDHGDALGSHGGHFDKASYMSEEVMRIPLAISWKDRIKANTKSSAYVSNLDIPSTILAGAGTSFKNEVAGKSILDIALGKKEKVRDYAYSETYGHGYGNLMNSRMVVLGDIKYVASDNDLHELYNLKEDPYELRNLAYIPEYHGSVLKMQSLIKKSQKEYDDNLDVIKSYKLN